jgi:hypothetical protein
VIGLLFGAATNSFADKTNNTGDGSPLRWWGLCAGAELPAAVVVACGYVPGERDKLIARSLRRASERLILLCLPDSLVVFRAAAVYQDA